MRVRVNATGPAFLQRSGSWCSTAKTGGSAARSFKRKLKGKGAHRRVCRNCGKPLSPYNRSKQCYSHDVFDNPDFLAPVTWTAGEKRRVMGR